MQFSSLFLLSLDQTLGLVLGILVFAALMAGMFLLLKWLSRRGFAGTSGRRMKALDRLVLSKDSSVMILQIGLRLFAVSVGRDGVRLISELKSSDFEQSAPEQAQAARAGFFRRFIHNMKINMRLAPKDAKPMGPGASIPAAHDSFADVLAQVARRESENPSPDVSVEGESGRPHVEETAAKPDYQSRIDQMKRWGEPDSLDRRASGAGAVSAAPKIPKYSRPAAPASPAPITAPVPVTEPVPAEPAPKAVKPEPVAEAVPETIEAQEVEMIEPAAEPIISDSQPYTPPEESQTVNAQLSTVNAHQPQTGEKIDMLLDMISKRQGRYSKGSKNSGGEGKR